MSKRLQVLRAVKQLLAASLPDVRVIGMSQDEAKPETIPAEGLIIVRSGDPGNPEIDMSPPTYNYEHEIPVEIALQRPTADTVQADMDAMMGEIDTAIAIDRTLGGLCNYLVPTAPTDGEMDVRGARPIGWADFSIIASYETLSPLG